MEKSKLIVGLMSGTSLNGIDAVLLRVRGSGPSTKFRQLGFVSRRFPRGLKELLLKNSLPGTSRVDDITRLNFVLAELYSDAVRAVAQRAGKRLSEIDLIGSHGQTIQHLPRPHKVLGKTVRSTLQIGDPSVLATLTGICTVGDFRVADMAVGGQGAPLVPYFDWLVFRSDKKHRILLNIGGIANITVLPRNCSVDEVIAFDTGPGNMVVDALMHRYYARPFDRDGRVAARGMISHDLFGWMKKHPYVRRRPPKSTGREEFGESFVEELVRRARSHDRVDVVATASLFTAFAVFESYRRFIKHRMAVDELIVSGGGAKNKFFLAALQDFFLGGVVRTVEQFGMASEAKEATCFAILANETIAGRTANVPAVTGARKRVVLGKICLG